MLYLKAIKCIQVNKYHKIVYFTQMIKNMQMNHDNFSGNSGV